MSGVSGEHGLVQRLRRSLDDSATSRPKTVLVGYSGGADSLALLAALGNLAGVVEFDLFAVHVDHGVRESSSSDAEIARLNAERLGVPCEVRTIAPDRLDAHKGVGREEALRRERYLALAEVAEERSAEVVALAHHQRDQAETVLLHLLRGAGIRGASGMQSQSTLDVPWWNDDTGDRPERHLLLWRPFLSEPAGELRSFAESLGLPIVEDSSNVDTSYRRNAVRHDVLPLLEQVSPGATATLARFAGLAGEDSAYLEELACDALNDILVAGDLDRVGLLALPVPLRRRVVQHWIASLAPATLEISLNRIDEVMRVATVPGPVRRVEIGSGLVVEVSRTVLRVQRAA